MPSFGPKSFVIYKFFRFIFFFNLYLTNPKHEMSNQHGTSDIVELSFVALQSISRYSAYETHGYIVPIPVDSHLQELNNLDSKHQKAFDKYHNNHHPLPISNELHLSIELLSLWASLIDFISLFFVIFVLFMGLRQQAGPSRQGTTLERGVTVSHIRA